MEPILGSTTLVVNRRDHISTLRQAPVYPKAVKLRWKQADIIYRLSNAFQSIDSGMLLVQIYGQQDGGKLASTLMPIVYLNVRVDTQEENIMVTFLLSTAAKNTIALELSNPYRQPSVSIHAVSVHSNPPQSIAYQISKRRLLQYWDDHNLTYMSDWVGIQFTLFKWWCDTTTVHMAHFIKKCMSNTLQTVIILHWRGHATTNLCLDCGFALDTIQYLHQCIHKGSFGRWTVRVDALQKWFEARNMDPYIAIFLADTLLYISG